MPSKRQVLEVLSRNELLAIVDSHHLQVEDQRVSEQLVDAIAASRKVDIVAALDELARDRLKELCRKLGIDDGGKGKASLIERLRFRFPTEFGGDSVLGQMISRIREANGTPLKSLQADLTTLEDLNTYSRPFHHGGEQRVPTPNEQELHTKTELAIAYMQGP